MDEELADQRRRHLGDMVKADRGRKFRTVDAARIAAKISRGTWDAVERGDSAKDFTYAAIEDALDWYPGRSRAILAGDDDRHSPYGRSVQGAGAAARQSPGDRPVLSDRVKTLMHEVVERNIETSLDQAHRVAAGIQDSDPENAARIVAEAMYIAEQLRQAVLNVTEPSEPQAAVSLAIAADDDVRTAEDEQDLHHDT